MTYVTDQTSEELRQHMQRLTNMQGWCEPLSDRLWKEIQEQDKIIAVTKTDIDASLSEQGLVAVPDRLLVLACKHCPSDHHDWDEVKAMVGAFTRQAL